MRLFLFGVGIRKEQNSQHRFTHQTSNFCHYHQLHHYHIHHPSLNRVNNNLKIVLLIQCWF